MPQAPLVVVMGVSGSGKTTVGEALAERLGVPFADADAFHPPANIAKMEAGTPLDDDDRHPWLEAIGAWLADHPDGGVVTCSALRRCYRDQLRRHAPRSWFLHLAGNPELLTRRQAARRGHFMPSSLMASQLETLEPLAGDERGLTVDVADPVPALVEQVVATCQP